MAGGAGHTHEGGEGGEGGKHDQLVGGVRSIICQELEVVARQGESFSQDFESMIVVAQGQHLHCEGERSVSMVGKPSVPNRSGLNDHDYK